MLGHVRPDGDALGSQLALGLSLQKLGKNVRVWNEEGMLEKYSFLPRAELLTKPPANRRACGCCHRARHRNSKPVGHDAGRRWVGENLDQHRPSLEQSRLWRLGDHRSDRARDRRESFSELIKSQGLPLDHDIAENLFAAISTDTGSFQYPNTTARTFEIAAELVRDGDLDVGKISQQLYENYPRRRTRTFARAVANDAL